MNLYQKSVLEARKKFLKLSLQQEKELLSIYEEAGKQVMERLSKAKQDSLSKRHLSELNKSIEEYVSELRINLRKSIREGIMTSAEIAGDAQAAYFDLIGLNEDLKSTFRKMFSKLNTDVVKTLISGDYYKDGKTLDDRIWNISRKNARDIDRLIKINVVKGANARDLAKQLDNYINPRNRISLRPIYATNEKGNLVKVPPPSGISYNISYQAQRLARTSLDHANTEAYIQGSKKNPFCKGLKWNLSSSHYERQVKRHGSDVCDKYAKEDSYKLGEGVFPSDKYPISHPNCLCYCTTVTVDIDNARDELIAWVKGESNPKLDKWLEDYGEEFGIEGSHVEKFNIFSKPAVSKEINSSKTKMNLQLFSINEKEELEKLIVNGVINRNNYNECYNYFNECFKKGINTPLGTVYDKGDRYIHIARRHQYMISKEQINNIIDSLKDPDAIYKTKDKFGSEGNGYVKKVNKNELLTIVKDGIITAYYPAKNYIDKVKRGEIIWGKR